ncbi:MAG: hypothetical protein QOC81_725 [Thermoanaerobaculia bacterium]|jgi:hypothetical protein|nr:hypothetical protein [Thermoanaerobaculia bacterium]
MKRLLVSLALALASTAAFAEVADRDVLVAPDGMVFTVETRAEATSPTVATPMLVLTIQNGTVVSQVNVPDSVSQGTHTAAALAYDSDSKTLFVLWIHKPNEMSSELLLTSYRDGKWQPAVTIDSQTYTVRSNLRLGITRRVSQLQKDGTYADVPALLLHAIWWDEAGNGDAARYALLPVENGAVSPASIEIHSLAEFVTSGTEKYNSVDAGFNKEILKHPAIVSSPMQSGVDIVFGDTKTNSFHSVTLRPIADTRVHIPVGIGGGGGRPFIPAPASFSADWNGPISVISRADRLVLANASDKSLNYITYASGAWTAVKSIAIDSKFPAEAALAALDKMVSTQ